MIHFNGVLLLSRLMSGPRWGHERFEDDEWIAALWKFEERSALGSEFLLILHLWVRDLAGGNRGRHFLESFLHV